jgi:hypothetical protein
MRYNGYLVFVLVAAPTLTGGPALANVCQTGKLTCATTMPVGGYCECTAHGTTEGGTVVSKPESRGSSNSTAGGCGAQPDAPDCR